MSLKVSFVTPGMKRMRKSIENFLFLPGFNVDWVKLEGVGPVDNIHLTHDTKHLTCDT